MARSKSGGHPGKRNTRKLKVIPEPADGTRAVIVPDENFGEKPIMRGQGSGPLAVDFVCGSCERVLLAGISPGQVRDVVFRCPGCGAFNDTHFAPELN